MRPVKAGFALFKDFDPTVRWIAAVRMIGALGFALSLPFLAIYLHEELHIPMTHIGLMLSISGVVGSMSAAVGGAWSDRVGRRSLLVPLIAARILVFLALAGLVYWRQPFLLFAAVYVINGILGTATFPVMDAAIADVVPGARRNEAYGLLRVAANFGWAFGPAIGGIILVSGYHYLFIATAVALSFMLGVVLTKLPETAPASPSGVKRKVSVGAFLAEPHLTLFLGILLIMFLVRGQLVATLSVYASGSVGLTKFQIGLLYFTNAGMVTVLQVPVTRLIREVPVLRALVMAALLYAVGYLCVGWAVGLASMIGAVMLVTVAEIIEGPTATAYVSALAPVDKAGAYMGGYNLVMHLGWTVGPLIGGAMLDRFAQPAHAWEMIALMGCLSAAGFMAMALAAESRAKSEAPRV